MCQALRLHPWGAPARSLWGGRAGSWRVPGCVLQVKSPWGFEEEGEGRVPAEGATGGQAGAEAGFAELGSSQLCTLCWALAFEGSSGERLAGPRGP